jgi:hypothetical protein
VVIVHIWLGEPPWDLIEKQFGEYRHAAGGGAASSASGEGLIHSNDAAEVAARVVARLRAVRADALNVRVHVAGLAPEEAREQIMAIAREVVPRVRAEWQL